MKNQMDLQNRKIRLFLPILAGCVLGSVLFACSPLEEFWQNCIFRQGMGTGVTDFQELLTELCAVPLLWLLCMAVSGTSWIGMPLVYGLLVCRGMALGTVLCRVYMLQGIAGLLTAVLFVMPYALCSLLIYLTGAEKALQCTTALHSHGEMTAYLRRYALHILLLAALLEIVGVLQCFWMVHGYPVYLSFMAGK